MKKVDLSVVIPTFNGGELLERQVDAVLASAASVRGDVEVILSDNMSTDGAVEHVVRVHRTDERGEVRWVYANRRPGVSHARNVGISAASGERIAICDADDEVHVSWVPAMIGAITESTPYVTGPLDLDTLNPEWARSMRGRRVYEEPARFDGVVPFAHGCNIGVHRRLLDRIGVFDEDLAGGGGDDVEFGARVWRCGIELRWEPEARIAYRYRLRLRDAYRQGRAYGATRSAIRSAAPYIPIPGPASCYDHLRRVMWVVRHCPKSLVDRETRARWVWVLSQLDGEARAYFAAVLDREPERNGSEPC